MGHTRYPIKQVVLTTCPYCHREVRHERSVYPDVVYYTCMAAKHHWKFYLEYEGQAIPGGGFIEPPRGYNEEQ